MKIPEKLILKLAREASLTLSLEKEETSKSLRQLCREFLNQHKFSC